jgi:hypothetical protein
MTGNHCVDRRSCPINSRFRATQPVELERQTFSTPLRTGLLFEAISLVSLAGLLIGQSFHLPALGLSLSLGFP